MSSELHKHIEKSLKEKENLFNAEVIDFPNEKKTINKKNFEIESFNFWKLNDKTNTDQLRTVVGICLMFFALIVMGLYSNLM